MTELPIADLADTLARVLHPEYNALPLRDAIVAVDKLLAQIEEARMWARHGYELGQRSNTWSDHGVAPAWLTAGHACTRLSDDESEAEIDAAMAAGEPVEIVDLPELTTEDAVEAMQDMAGDLYNAQDRLAFVREMCDAADRNGQQVTTEQVRAWTNYTGCGGVLRLPDEVMPLLREFAANEGVATPATQATIPPGSPDGSHGYAAVSERLPDGTCPDWCPCHRLKGEQR